MTSREVTRVRSSGPSNPPEGKSLTQAWDKPGLSRERLSSIPGAESRTVLKGKEANLPVSGGDLECFEGKWKMRGIWCISPSVSPSLN